MAKANRLDILVLIVVLWELIICQLQNSKSLLVLPEIVTKKNYVSVNTHTAAGDIHARRSVGSGDPPPPPSLCRKHLQMNHENGGMIVFWHIFKTGGSTLRRRYHKRTHKKVRRWVDMRMTQETYLKKKSQAEATFLSDTHTSDPYGYHGSTLFWEIHEGPSLSTLNHDIVRWRSIAKQNNKTLFVFTLFREAPSAAISYFNFYCPPCDSHQFGFNFENTEQDFLRTSLTWRNYQSRILFHGDYGDGKLWLNRTITAEESWHLYQNSELDWIGTTETLSNTTIPILEYLITGKHVPYQSAVTVPEEKVASARYKHTNISHIRRSDLSLEAMHFLEENTSLDQPLWQWARRDYHWESNNASIIQTPC